MTGYESKRAAARDKLNDDDDTQVYGDALTIAYQSGYYDGKKQRPWVGLTRDEVLGIEEITKHPLDFYRAIEAKLKERNA